MSMLEHAVDAFQAFGLWALWTLFIVGGGVFLQKVHKILAGKDVE